MLAAPSKETVQNCPAYRSQVVSRGEDGTYTVRFKSRVPWRGFVIEHGVSESRLRMVRFPMTDVESVGECLTMSLVCIALHSA